MVFKEGEMFKHNDLFQGFDVNKYIKDVKLVKQNVNFKDFILIENDVQKKIHLKDSQESLKVLFNPSSIDKSSLALKLEKCSCDIFIYLIDLIEGKSFQSSEIQILSKNSNVNIFLLSFSKRERIKFITIKNFVYSNSNVNFDVAIFDNTSKYRFENFLLSKNCNFNLNGITLAKNFDKLDLYFTLNHINGYNNGKVSFRGIADDFSKIILKGLINIEKKAKESNSYLSLHSFIANQNSSSQVLPMLKIENNEVRATHSGSSLQFLEEKLFYLQSRGLTEEQSKKLILDGFLNYSIMLMQSKEFIFRIKFFLEKKFNNENFNINDLLVEIKGIETLKIGEFQEFFERHYKYR